MNGLFRPEWSTLKKLIFLQSMGGEAWNTIVGNPVSFTAKAAPLRQLQVAFSPVQSGSGDPSPDNVRPISGWSSLTVEQAGKNLLFAEAFQNGLAGINIGDDIDSITPSTRYIYSYVIPARSGVSFSIKSHDLAKVNFYSVNRYAGRKLVDRALVTLTDTDTHTNTYAENLYDYVRINIGAPSGAAVNFEDVDVQLELGTNVTPYEAGTGRSISISLGQTVYSGWVDVVTGVVTVTGGVGDMASFTWNTTTYGFVSYDVKNVAKTYPNNVPNNVIFESYESKPSRIGGFYTGEPNVISLNANGYLYTSAPVAPSGKIYYGLAEPLTIQLTPQEVQSLLGENVLFSDANGDLTVEYRSN